MILQQALPSALAGRGRRRPSHLRLAVGASLAIHAAAGLYLAYMTFNPPPSATELGDRVIDAPIVTLRRLSPPKHLEQPKPVPPLHPPVVRDSLPLEPLPEAPPPAPVPPLEPPATIAPPQPLAPPAPRPPASISPDWLRKPSAEELARAYPERALRRDVQGSATL